MREPGTPVRAAISALALFAAGVLGSCSLDVDDEEVGVAGSVPARCAAVDVASSPDKAELLTDVAKRFNATAAQPGDDCAFVRVYDAPSGLVAEHLAKRWRGAASVGPRPVMWSPSARSWGMLLNEEVSTPLVDLDAPSFVTSPLVVAVPKPMAEALGWPDHAIGFGDLVQLATDPAGWGARGHPEWGRFTLGKSNLALATAGLSSTIAAYYAGAAKIDGLTIEDVDRPEVAAFVRGLESAVIHYGNSTAPFLENLSRRDAEGTALEYVSAVLVEEQAVVAYNRGEINADPDVERRPSTPLVAIYPREGTVVSDHPLFVVDARWVSAKERAAARRFQEFARTDASQRAALEEGFRPVQPGVDVASALGAAEGVDPAQPAVALPLPSAAVLERVIASWRGLEKGSTVIVALDVSGSMGEEIGAGITKLDLVRKALVEGIRELGGDDEIALRAFSTEIDDGHDVVDLVALGPSMSKRRAIRDALDDLEPEDGTALYATVASSVAAVKQVAAPDRINAVVVITDGRNEDDYDDLDATLRTLSDAASASAAAPVRVFTVGYGGDADRSTLERMAAATGGASYDASDPGKITTVLEAVFSNF